MNNTPRTDPKLDERYEDKFCKYCGQRLQLKYWSNGALESPSQYNRRTYCNRICMRKNYIKYTDTQNWFDAHSTSRNVAKLYKDNLDTCEICGKKGKMDVHHIDGNYNNNSPDNLQIVCRSCHNKIHRGKKKCSIEGCDNLVKGYGYCDKHYSRYKKYGSPYIVKWNTRHTKYDKDVVEHEDILTEVSNDS